MSDGFRTPPGGLDAAQVRARVAEGRTNAVRAPTSRTYADIVRANVFTFFNGLLGTLMVVVLLTGRWQNALFGGVIAANAVIGIVQEVRAKRTLDRLAVLNEPRVRAVRAGQVVDLAVEDVVADDLLVLRAGDQVPADGDVVASEGLELDESLLTGESEAVAKQAGDEVRSGSIVMAGEGRFQATAVGAEAYATQLAAQARRFTVTHSELVAGTTRILRWISVMMVVVGPLLVWSQFHSVDNETWTAAITSSVAALVGMVPEGLVLLTSLAFMIGTVTLARRRTLVQELPAIEGLARVDVVCLDKTGTLTDGEIAFDRVEPLAGFDRSTVEQALALLTVSPGGNLTAAAIAAAMPAPTWRAVDMVAFSSARKWSATSTEQDGTWVLGAPEMVLPQPGTPEAASARTGADRLAASGRRVLLLARCDELTADLTLPEDGAVRPAALVVLGERIRPDAASTLAQFTEEGVTLVVISGDNPRTVGAVAAAVGLPGVSGPDDAVDARTLSDDAAGWTEALARHRVFGRVTPQQKRAVVAALQAEGHVVAMTGDGVNDALALKDADIGIAMGSGSPATRAVAQLVLLDGRFSHLPEVVAEGRRVIANIERAAGLFLVKNAYSLVLAIISAVTLAAYPLEPVQLSLISVTTIGVPGFFLALGPNRRRYVPGFLWRVLRFAVPTGAVVAGCAQTAYWFLRTTDPGGGVAGARTAATITVLIAALWVLLVSARPLTGWKLGLFAVIAGVVAVVVLFPPLANGVFLLEVSPTRLAVAGVSGAAAAVFVEITHRAVEAAARLTRR